MKEEKPQLFFIVLPVIKIWNDDAHVHQSAIHYPDYEIALQIAERLSKQYNCEFYILEAKSIVKSITIVTSLY